MFRILEGNFFNEKLLWHATEKVNNRTITYNMKKLWDSIALREEFRIFWMWYDKVPSYGNVKILKRYEVLQYSVGYQ